MPTLELPRWSRSAGPLPAAFAALAAQSSGSALTIVLSKCGITSDATNGVDFGVSAPPGATGQEAAINAILAAAYTAVTTLNVPGIKVVWDVAVALGGPIYLYSGMTVEAPSPACGAIVRAGAQCPVFRLKGMDADQTVAANSQKSFGKYDPAHSGDTRYRVFDPAYVNARNVTILGGTWNANSLQQPQVADDATNSAVPAYGFLNVFSFWGIDGLTIKDVRLFLAPAFVVHCLNCRHVLIDSVDIDQRLVASGYYTDGLHFNGPAEDITIRRARTHTYDDHIAFSPNDAQFSFLTPGVNWTAGGGPITGVLVDDWELWGGRDGVTPHGAMRLLSTVSKVDQVTVRNVRGQTAAWTFLLEPWSTSILNGGGVFGRVVIENSTLDLVNTGATSGSGVIGVSGTVDSLDVKGRYRANAQNFPDINVEQGAVIQALRWEGDCYQPTGATNNVPVVKVAGAVNLLSISGRSTRDPAMSTAAAPFVQVASEAANGQRSASTGAVTTIEADVTGEHITNLVDIQAGTVGTVILRGSHRNAGGGAPLNVASGATVTNYVSTGLVYDHSNVAASSGAGTITRLDYNESSAVTYATAYTTALSRSSGASGSAVTVTFTPSGGSWPASTVLTPSVAGVAGAFSPTTLSPTGSGAATVTFTPSATGTASLGSSTSPGMTNTTGALGYTVTAAPAPGATVLDAISTQPVAAYGLRKMRSAYSGKAVQVRRSSDNTKQDIGFNGSGGLDTASLLSFVGSGSATVSTWYDQTGNGHDLGNPAVNAASAEPTIVSAGAVTMANGVPTTTMAGGTNLYGAGAGITGLGNAATFVAVAQHTGGSDTTLFCYVVSGSSSYGTTGAAQGVNATSGTAYAYRSSAQATVTSTAVQSLFQVSTVYDGANEGVTLNNGTTVTAASSGAFAAGNTYLGAAYNGNVPLNGWNGAASELILYGTNLAAADLSILHANQAAFFGTP